MLGARIFDVIVAGGGPAGCVLAARLSEDPGTRVLLLDAGPDGVVPGSEDRDLLDPFALIPMSNHTFQWPQSVADGEPFIQGYGIGGGSNINGMGADRGQPGDYDGWRDDGADGWAWDDVLPFFVKLERDLDMVGPLHGNRGPMPVKRVPRTEWGPFTAAIGEALEQRGFEFLEDYMTDFREGFAAVPMNRLPNRRVSAAMAYLTREVRARPNLSVVANSRVERIAITGDGVDGVVVRRELIRGRHVIVSCGALQSPALLMRSGIGPADHLREHGIDVVRDLPGVGANLQNHPCVRLTVYLDRDAAQQRHNGSFLQNWMRLSSHHPDAHENDLHLIFFNKMGWHELGSHVGSVAVSLLQPFSAGRVLLTGADPAAPLNASFKLLSDKRDGERLVAGLRFALDLLADPRVVRTRGEAFEPNFAFAERLGKRTRANAFGAGAIASVLDRGPLRRLILRQSLVDLDHLSEDGVMSEYVETTVFPQLHPTGTCRIGSADDPRAVVDPAGRVHGVDRLRVADASIFPTIPRGYTHFLVLMAAEKLAESARRTCDPLG